MKLHTKIFVGYFLLSLVFAGGVLLSLKTLGPIERTFERFAVENVPVLTYIQDVRSLGTKLHAEMLEMAYLLSLDVTPESRRALAAELADITATRKRLQDATREYTSLVTLYFPEESAYIPLLQTQVDMLVQFSDELLNLTPGQSGKISLKMKQRFEALETQFLAISEEIISHEVHEIHERRMHVSASVEAARFWIGMTLVTLLIVTILISLWLSRRITRPVNRLVSAVERYGTDRVSRPVEIESSDEVGQLAETFNRMMRKIDRRKSERIASSEEEDGDCPG